MTKSVEQARRELFEAWFDKRAFGRTDVISAWEGFNAALDAVTIELPARMNSSLTITGGLLDAEHNATIEECRAAIESTGLGLKIK